MATRQDVLEQFLSTCRVPEGSPHLPWDLLIVDECHNLMPAPFGIIRAGMSRDSGIEILERAAHSGDQLALQTAGGDSSYRQLVEAAERVAAGSWRPVISPTAMVKGGSMTGEPVYL